MTAFTIARRPKSRTLTSLSKARCVWDNPEASIGTWYRKMGKLDCWQAKGLARDTFDKLAEEIRIYLEKRCDSVNSTVTWSMYMIGKTKQTATPTVMFCCLEPTPRKRVRKTIEESGILNKYPGVNTGDCTEAPDLSHLVQFNQPNPSNPLVQLASSGELDCNASPAVLGNSKTTVLYDASQGLSGAPIFIKDSSGCGSSLRRATAGGIYRTGTRYFVQTVAHAFTESTDLQPLNETSDVNFEFDISGQSDSDDEDDETIASSRNRTLMRECSDCKSEEKSDAILPYVSTELVGLHTNSGEDWQEFEVTRSKNLTVCSSPLSVLGDVVLSSTDGKRADLDYTLIEIRGSSISSSDKVIVTDGVDIDAERIAGPKPLDANVVARTGSSGLMEGKLSGTPSFLKLPYKTSFQEVWTVRFAGPIAEGDCGSWVVDVASGDVYGHIVAGSPKSGVAYIIPAHQVYEDLKERFNSNRELSSKPGQIDEEATEAQNVPDNPCSRLYRRPPTKSPNCELRYELSGRRRKVYEAIEQDETQYSRWVMLIAGLGFFTDSYTIFTSNLISPMIGIVYHRGNMNLHNLSTRLNAATLIAMILGQIGFGAAADIVGRRKIYPLALIMTICGTLGMALTSSDSSGLMSFASWLMFWRFIAGIGIGADYPLSAVITSEFAPTRFRGRMLTAMFMCQALGQMMAHLFALAAGIILHQFSTFDATIDALDLASIQMVDSIWRLIVGAGAIPAVLALILRLTVPETPRYTLDVLNDSSQAMTDLRAFACPDDELKDAKSFDRLGVSDCVSQPADRRLDIARTRTEDELLDEYFDTRSDEPSTRWTTTQRRRAVAGMAFTESAVESASHLKPCREAFVHSFWRKENLQVLSGAALTWFVLDFAFYGLSLNSPLILNTLWPVETAPETPVYIALTQSASHSLLIVSTGAIIGSLITIFTIESIGRRMIQMNGFFWLCISLAVLGISTRYLHTAHGSAATIVLYILCQAFFNFGPNTTTFIIPAESFPTRYRCTAFGISAAFGKLGSVLAQYFIAHVKFAGTDYGSSQWLSYVLLVFSMCMLVGLVTTMYWTPDVRDKHGAARSLEELARGRVPSDLRNREKRDVGEAFDNFVMKLGRKLCGSGSRKGIGQLD